MDKREARALLDQEVTRYRARGYEGLLTLLGTVDAFELTGPSGTTYQFEVQAIWDDRTRTRLRILLAVDDGGWSAFVPMTDDFVIDNKGSFVGE